MYVRCSERVFLNMKIIVFIFLTLPYVASLVNLGPACQNMWNNAGNNLIVPGELTVNQVANGNPLFTVVGGGNAKLANSPVFARFRDMLNDYHGAFVLNQQSQQHINVFITEVTQPGGSMEAALKYLLTQHSLPQGVTTLEQFRCVLEELWFRESDGFKNVFVGEENAHNYTGFHNWYQFLLEQQRNPPQTTNICFKQPPQLPGFVENRLPYFLRDLSFTWRGVIKVPAGSSSSMFVGTSPDFDLAMFTTCVLMGRQAVGVAPGNPRTTDCGCQIQTAGPYVQALGLPSSQVEFRTVEDTKNKWVVTAYPTNVR